MGSRTNTRGTVSGSEEKKVQMGVPNVGPSKGGGGGGVVLSKAPGANLEEQGVHV